MTDAKRLVQDLFTRTAEAYAASPVHARGASLGRAIELACPRPADGALDVATGPGHTALGLAPLVRRVVGLDLAAAMFAPARRMARERNLANVEWMAGDVECLPLASASFEIVICRIALHHWPDAARGVREMARVAKTGGRVVLVDNVVPDAGPLAEYVNRFEQTRDPSHHCCYSIAELAALFATAGLSVRSTEALAKPIVFDEWVQRAGTPESQVRALRDMLLMPEAAASIRPEADGESTRFYLTEAIIAGVKEN